MLNIKFRDGKGRKTLGGIAMDDYILSCSSTADMTNGYYSDRDIHHINIQYDMEGVLYDDNVGESMPLSDFYKKIRDGANPSISQIDTEKYKEYFEEFLKEGRDIFHVCLSSGISDAYGLAMTAAKELMGKYPDRQVYVLDSLSASAGMGMLLDLLANKRDEGLSLDKLKSFAENSKRYINHWFFSTDLKTYVKEKVISDLAIKPGKTPNFCPLLCVNGEGKIVVIEKIRTKKKTMEAIVSRMETQAVDGTRYNGKCFISHSDSEKDAVKLANMIEARFPNLKGKVVVNEIGKIVGMHTGVGTVAVFFVGSKR